MDIVVGFKSCNWTFVSRERERERERGINLTLEPKLQSALLICISPIEQGIEKLPKYYSFDGDLLYKTVLHTSLIKPVKASLTSPF